MEAIVRIFRDLDLEEESTFPFEIEYICRGKSVRIVCDEGVGAEPASRTRFARRFDVELEGSQSALGEKVFLPLSEPEFFPFVDVAGE